jgi:hypothetical protein
MDWQSKIHSFRLRYRDGPLYPIRPPHRPRRAIPPPEPGIDNYAIERRIAMPVAAPVIQPVPVVAPPPLAPEPLKL